MTIANLSDRIKRAMRAIPRDVLVFLIIVCASVTSFGIGYLSGKRAISPVVFKSASFGTETNDFIASKTGSRYYVPWCSGVDKISPENRIHFPSEAAAQQAGYTPAKNCDGL